MQGHATKETEAVKPNLFLPLMILLSVSTRVVNAMFCCWTSVRPLIRFLILVYVIRKLHHYGIHGALLSWLQAFLHNRSQYVIVDNQRSHLTPVLSGVPQGTVLAPVIPNLYK